jgi:hypothetical protein
MGALSPFATYGHYRDHYDKHRQNRPRKPLLNDFLFSLPHLCDLGRQPTPQGQLAGDQFPGTSGSRAIGFRNTRWKGLKFGRHPTEIK